jgi:crossover junction endodeoxyribonuclease RusA
MVRMSEIAILLPFPPSTNSIWRNFGGRTIKSERYRVWQVAAAGDVRRQGSPKIAGPYEIDITLERKDRRRRDLGNFEKSVSDLLVSCGVVEDDCLAQRVTLSWGAVDGCKVIVKPACENRG